MSKIIDLAKKLKALADRGENGERTNADLMLKRHLEKHGITLEDIEREEVRAHSFKCQHKQKKIFVQIIVMVMGKDIEIWGSKRSRNEFIIDCTPAQYIEIEAAFDFYWKAYQDELKVFTKAFIYKNNLLPCDAETASSELSAEEAMKLASMMNGIERRTLQKQLKAG